MTEPATFPAENPRTGLPWTVADLLEVVSEHRAAFTAAVYAGNAYLDVPRGIQIRCAQTEVLWEQTGAHGMPGIPVYELDMVIRSMGARQGENR